MKKAKKLLCFALCAVLAGSLAACGEKNEPIVGTSDLPQNANQTTVAEETTVLSSETDTESTEETPSADELRKAAATAQAAVSPTRSNPVAVDRNTILKAPPNASGQFTFQLGETGLVHVFYLFADCYTWSYVAENGDTVVLPELTTRPCDAEKPRSIKLGEPDDGVVQIQLSRTDLIENVTVTAYPIGNYESGIVCELVDGKLTLLEDARYYEIVVTYTQGTVTYGFFAE